eukprot:scaffold157688_cov31-Attheya_sp.AAC.2
MRWCPRLLVWVDYDGRNSVSGGCLHGSVGCSRVPGKKEEKRGEEVVTGVERGVTGEKGREFRERELRKLG